MKTVLTAIVSLAAIPCMAADHILIQLRENDSSVLLLDRAETDGSRRAAVLTPSQSPGRVIVERKKHPDPADWTEVRWVIRFDLSQVPTMFRQAKLHVWCQGTAGAPKVMPKLELIASSDPQRIVSADRMSQPLLSKTQEIVFPERPQMIELDVTAMVQEAQKQKQPSAAFRISAVCDQPECETGEPQNFYLGSFTNVWQWPQSEPPVLEIIP